jgi:hypothetical protein
MFFHFYDDRILYCFAKFNIWSYLLNVLSINGKSFRRSDEIFHE